MVELTNVWLKLLELTKVWLLSRRPMIGNLILSIGSYGNFGLGHMFRFGFGGFYKVLALFTESCEFEGLESSQV